MPACFRLSRLRPVMLARLLVVTLALALLPAVTPAPTTAQAAPSQTENPEVLRVGLLPNIAPDAVRARYQPFGEYLSAALGMPVELFVATDYTGVVEAMASEKLDIAWFGGLTYVLAEQRVDLTPIVTQLDAETGTSQYYSAIITRPDSGIETTADIAGRVFAFGDIGSTSGSLYPRIMLDRAGITNFEDPALFIYTGGHDATTLAVANGTVDAGGVEKRIMQELIAAGRADGSQLRVIEESLVEGYPWCVRTALGADLTERITVAFEQMTDPALLKLFRATGHARVTAADYEEARTEARRVGLVR
ncbi:MAG: phosphate/phosphite/phosphonate ABC transporter substrate-binding protein [Chloroflexota bacterium]